MVYVKLIKSSQTGKVILPSHFPFGVLAKRFGDVKKVNVKSYRLKTLSDIDGYLVVEGDKLVIKPITKSDKGSYLLPFIVRIEEQLERTNDFTRDYEVYPKDIFFETQTPQELEESQGETRETSSVIFDDEQTEPIDLYYASKQLSSQQEEEVLKASINHYLIKIKLKPIDEESNQYPLHFLSTKGDALLKYALLDYFTNRKVLTQLVTNDSMKLALGRMGFYEFLEADSHLAGTFFEVIYACAMLQGNHEIRKKMERVLVGEEAFKTKLPTLKFKKLK